MIFCAFYKFIGWHCWSLGIHVCLKHGRLDIHLPGGFLTFGWYDESDYPTGFAANQYGLGTYRGG